MFNNFDLELTNIFKSSEEERLKLRHPYVGTEHLLLAILKNDEEMANFFEYFGLTYDSFKRELISIVGNATKSSEINLYTPMLKRVINNASIIAKEDNRELRVKDLVISMLEEGEGIAIRLIIGMGIDLDKIYDGINSNYKINSKKLEILETGTLLNKVIDLDEVVVGRDKEIEEIIETLLRKKKNNPILLGEAGVGKTAIVEELVRRIERHEVPDSLYNTKVISLEMGSLVSGTKYRGEFEEKLTKIINELENNEKIILFIDEIHAMVQAGGAEGAITAGDIFKPALARGKIKVIGATTSYEYNKYFSGDKALMRRFEVVNVREPNLEETKDILLKIKGEYESHHHVKITNDIIDLILKYADIFITNKKNPDKSIDFLDSVCSKVKTTHGYNNEKKKLHNELDKLNKKKADSIKKNDYESALGIYKEELDINKKLKKYNTTKSIKIKESDIIEVLENKTNMIFTKDKLKCLDNIKNKINNELFGVEEITDKIIKTMYNNLIDKKGFLKIYLSGEKYLGKSSLVNIIGNNFPKANYIKINLNEYRNETDINKLIGSNKGYIGYGEDHLFSKLNNNFTIILFDNYNYAHKNIKELIKNILKNKYIIDNKGEKIAFNNTFIFITDDIVKENKIGFNNKFDENSNNELSDLVDETINFASLNKKVLEAYLDKLKIKDKEKIINISNYEKDNYKNISKIIKNQSLIVS